MPMLYKMWVYEKQKTIGANCSWSWFTASFANWNARVVSITQNPDAYNFYTIQYEWVSAWNDTLTLVHNDDPTVTVSRSLSVYITYTVTLETADSNKGLIGNSIWGQTTSWQLTVPSWSWIWFHGSTIDINNTWVMVYPNTNHTFSWWTLSWWWAVPQQVTEDMTIVANFDYQFQNYLTYNFADGSGTAFYDLDNNTGVAFEYTYLHSDSFSIDDYAWYTDNTLIRDMFGDDVMLDSFIQIWIVQINTHANNYYSDNSLLLEAEFIPDAWTAIQTFLASEGTSGDKSTLYTALLAAQSQSPNTSILQKKPIKLEWFWDIKVDGTAITTTESGRYVTWTVTFPNTNGDYDYVTPVNVSIELDPLDATITTSDITMNNIDQSVWWADWWGYDNLAVSNGAITFVLYPDEWGGTRNFRISIANEKWIDSALRKEVRLYLAYEGMEE